jgi:hypothetical protein
MKIGFMNFKSIFNMHSLKAERHFSIHELGAKSIHIVLLIITNKKLKFSKLKTLKNYKT